MSEEYLEFAAQDFGRLAAHLDDLDRVLEWVGQQGFEAPRVRNAVIEGYQAAKEGRPRQ